MRHDREGASLAAAILSVMKDEKQIFDEKDRSVQIGKQESSHAAGGKRASVPEKLHGKQELISDGHAGNEKQRVGEKECQTRSER